MTLSAAVSGERFELSSVAGKLAVYVAGAGPPLLLVHSVNAAGSAAEVRPIHERYRAARTVYSMELPGFGASERSDRVYTPRLMTDAVIAVADEIRRRHGAQPIDALALSLSSEFLARAAVLRPELFRSLALISPTGFSGTRARRGAPGSTGYRGWLYRVLRGPGWGGALFRALTRPSVIRYFLRRTFGRREIDETLWAYDIETARVPGAEHAPLYFLSGGLFSADIHDVYDKLTAPVWMAHGVRGDFTDYAGAAIVADKASWQFRRFDTGALPYFEVPEEFFEAYDAFLAG